MNIVMNLLNSVRFEAVIYEYHDHVTPVKKINEIIEIKTWIQ